MRAAETRPRSAATWAAVIFAQAIALYAETYADQTERDHAALLAAIKEGRIKAEVDV